MLVIPRGGAKAPPNSERRTMLTTKQQKQQDAYLAALLGNLAKPGYHSDERPGVSCGSAQGEKKDERIIPPSSKRGESR